MSEVYGTARPISLMTMGLGVKRTRSSGMRCVSMRVASLGSASGMHAREIRRLATVQAEAVDHHGVIHHDRVFHGGIPESAPKASDF